MIPGSVDSDGLLAGWIAAPRPDRGIRFRCREGWEFWSYERLAHLARAHAAQLAARSVGGGDVVAIARPAGPGFVGAFFGAWLVGAIPAPLAPPSIMQSQRDYVAHLAGILEVAAPRTVCVDERSRGPVGLAAASATLVQEPLLIDEPADPASSVPEASLATPPSVALIQFSSGSTAPPHGVEISWRNLGANVAMIRRWLDIDEHDATATWLPLHHDMGLIGCLLTPVSAQSDISMMKPEQFIHRPLDWLRCFDGHGATMTAIPNFALRLLLRAGRGERGVASTGALDLSRWKALIVGAERLDAAAMAEFVAWLRPLGFEPRALLPAYGLAEATLAVAGSHPETAPTAVTVDHQRLRVGGPVEIVRRNLVGGDPARFTSDGWLVGCGAPLDGIRIEITDDRGSPLLPDHLGEITVSGPTIAPRIRGSITPGSRDRSRLQTGDLGFMSNGELFVLGRRDDRVELAETITHVEDLEAILARLPRAPAGRFACLVDPESHARVALVAERPDTGWLADSEDALRAHLGPGVDLRTVRVELGTILRTTSGKVRRRRMWDQLQLADPHVGLEHSGAEQR